VQPLALFLNGVIMKLELVMTFALVQTGLEMLQIKEFVNSVMETAAYAPTHLPNTQAVTLLISFSAAPVSQLALPLIGKGGNISKSFELTCPNENEFGDETDKRICKNCDNNCKTCATKPAPNAVSIIT
jgi:hypothetical protein